MTLNEVTRHISTPTQCMLWGKAAGRCEFAGCNKPLWKSSVTQEQVNIAQKAHIYSFSDDGPRGNKEILPQDLNDLGNLMLVCHECHVKIDKKKDGGRYSVPILQKWKAEHETRIEIVTGISADKRSHVVLYGANIGNHNSPLTFTDTAAALFPTHYPANDKPIELGMRNSSFKDRSPAFWSVETENLVTNFKQRVGERLASGEVSHLSIFALAPQPLLILLGSLMTDIPKAEVFQLHREPQGWTWPQNAPVVDFSVEEPTVASGAAVLVLALSATITNDRITGVLGSNVAIWKVIVTEPHNDFLKSPRQLSSFRALLRKLLAGC
jgi:SMODS-associated and fused to various effectors sensor domain